MFCRCATALWAGLLAVVLIAPFAISTADVGDSLIRNTIRLSLFYWWAAVNLLLFLRRDDWPAQTERGQFARMCWTLAWAAYLVHLGMAFHWYHGWSHAAAMEHTREVSGVGEGIYVSHLFTLLWTLDVAWWWLQPGAHARRSPWVDRLLHGFMAFVIFNGTVVYETGLIRWAGAAAFAELTAALIGARMRQSRVRSI